MEEIIDAIVYQLEGSDCIEKLTAGVVITGGGSLLRHLPQLVKYRTGLDVRIGKPEVLLANSDLKEVNHPMYSTSVGLLYKGFEYSVPEPMQEIPTKEPVPEFADENDNKILPPRHNRKIGSIFETFKNTIENIFDDDTDKKM
jgi:cell division protein FtsA